MKIACLAVAYMFVGALAWDAYQIKKNDNDAMAINKASISLAQAITTAEEYINGKAALAAYEQDKYKHNYKILVLSYSKLFDVIVDADKGVVISSRENKFNEDDD